MNWVVLYYVTAANRPIVKEFIDGLPKSTRAKTLRQISLLELKGTDLGMPHSKSLGDGLVELRVRSGRGTNEVRVFYIFEHGRRIFLLHGFVKKTQEIPEKEIKIARQRKQEVEEDL